MEFIKLTQAAGKLEEDQIFKIINELVERSPSDEEVEKAIEALQQGMTIVGDLYEKREYFVGDIIFAGELLREAINRLTPLISSGNGVKIGTIVLGTVRGDLHDIGKNIFKNMAESIGFEVHDIGIDQSAVAFIEKIKEVKPDIVGMSGVLTLSLKAMKDTVNELNRAGIRHRIKIIVGGNAITKEACEYIGADEFTTNAAEGVNICLKWVERGI